MTRKQIKRLHKLCIKRARQSGGTPLFWLGLALEAYQKGSTYEDLIRGLS